LTLAAGYWSTSQPGHFTPTGKYPDTPWIWGSLGSRAGLDVPENRKISWPYRVSNSGPSSPYPSCYINYAAPKVRKRVWRLYTTNL